MFERTVFWSKQKIILKSSNEAEQLAGNTHSTRDHMTDNVTSNFGLSTSGCLPFLRSLIEIQEDLRQFLL